jgi:hypothetical protein
VQQVSYGPLLIMSCYTGFFNVRRGWQSLLLSKHPSLRGCAGGRIDTRFIHPRSISPLKGVNPAGTPGYRNGTESFCGLKGRPSHGTSVLFTSHLKDGLVVNLYIPHNRRTPLQAEEALGLISIPQGSRGVGSFC